jgi:hypothetical protein
MRPLNEVLTSDVFHYWVGQGVFWALILGGVLLVVRRRDSVSGRVILSTAILCAFASSAMPLLVRWAAADRGFGGPDAAAEETILSFVGTLPQAICFVLLIWLSVRKDVPRNAVS